MVEIAEHSLLTDLQMKLRATKYTATALVKYTFTINLTGRIFYFNIKL